MCEQRLIYYRCGHEDSPDRYQQQQAPFLKMCLAARRDSCRCCYIRPATPRASYWQRKDIDCFDCQRWLGTACWDWSYNIENLRHRGAAEHVLIMLNFYRHRLLRKAKELADYRMLFDKQREILQEVSDDLFRYENPFQSVDRESLLIGLAVPSGTPLVEAF